MTISGFVEIPGTETGWRMEIIEEALTAPLHVGDIFGIPIGIFQIVLVVGLIIYKWHAPIHKAIRKMTDALSLKVMAFILIAVLGLFSSVISAILAAIILVEMVNAMPLSRKSKIDLTIIACFLNRTWRCAYSPWRTSFNNCYLKTIRCTLLCWIRLSYLKCSVSISFQVSLRMVLLECSSWEKLIQKSME